MRGRDVNEPFRFWFDVTMDDARKIENAKLLWEDEVNGISKPVVVPLHDDPEHTALADILFWSDAFLDHLNVLMMFMPGPELEPYQERASELRSVLLSRFVEASRAKPKMDDLRPLINDTLVTFGEVRELKKSILNDQQSGKIRTLMFPEFITHIISEVERTIVRLGKLNEGTLPLDKKEVLDFWSVIMGKHAQYASIVVRLFYPDDETLPAIPGEIAHKFFEMRKLQKYDGVYDMLEKMIGFNTFALQGIAANRISAIITPAFADHTRREAVKFRDELSRAK